MDHDVRDVVVICADQNTERSRVHRNCSLAVASTTFDKPSCDRTPMEFIVLEEEELETTFWIQVNGTEEVLRRYLASAPIRLIVLDVHDFQQRNKSVLITRGGTTGVVLVGVTRCPGEKLRKTVKFGSILPACGTIILSPSSIYSNLVRVVEEVDERELVVEPTKTIAARIERIVLARVDHGRFREMLFPRSIRRLKRAFSRSGCSGSACSRCISLDSGGVSSNLFGIRWPRHCPHVSEQGV